MDWQRDRRPVASGRVTSGRSKGWSTRRGSTTLLSFAISLYFGLRNINDSSERKIIVDSVNSGEIHSENVSASLELAEMAIAPNSRPCYIAVENKADYHYEVIESAIMQFPLPWSELDCVKEVTIADVALSRHHRFLKNEQEPWRNYFQDHLTGTVRPRSNGDGAIIHFGTIQQYINYSHEYDAYIGVSCDSYDWMRWMRGSPRNYCLLHGTTPILPEEFKQRVSWVNPMHPRYFIPSDLPKFHVKEFAKDDKIRLCLKTSTPDTSFQYVVEGINSLQHQEKKLLDIILMGRLKEFPHVFDNISDLVTLGYEPDFYLFQAMISNCHALLPLIHPWEKTSKKYFPWSGAGKLSGYMSQAIGLKLPLLVHKEIRDVYEKHLIAPSWTYITQNSSDVQSFVIAFTTMVHELPGYLLSKKSG